MSRETLTAALIERTNPTDRTVEIRDTIMPGLLIRIRPTGRKTFEVVSEKRDERKSEKLGRWPHMTVKMAREAAQRKLGEWVGRDALPERHIGTGTLREFAERYFERVHLKAGDEAERVLEASWTPLLDLRLRDITKGKIEEIRGRWARQGAAPDTINRKTTVLRGILSRAVEWGELLSHPMEGVKARNVPDDAKRIRMLSEAERGRLYGVLDAGDSKPELGTGIYLLLNSGMRAGELRGLRPVDVNLQTRQMLIRATTSKTAKSRGIPINSLLAERLTKFPTWKRPTRKEFDAILHRARVRDFTPKDCRSDFLSRLANRKENPVAMHVLKELAGHSTIAITARFYLNVPDAALRAAVEST